MRAYIYLALHLLHPLFKRIYGDRLRVLAYHKVPDEKTFERQVLYLKREYNLIGIQDLLAYFQNQIKLPNNPLLITFDDGDISVLQKGLPVLKKHGVKSCLFIITDLVNSSKDVWIKRVEAQEMKEGKTYQQARKVVNELKQMTNRSRLDRMHNYPEIKCPQLTTSDLKEMKKHGMFIGSHTHTHPMLNQCSPEEISEELEKSRSFFRKSDLEGFEVFAYPNGNENSQVAEVLKRFQMKLVFLFDHKINHSKIDPMRISRIRVDSDTELKEFKAKVSGAHPYVFNLKDNN